MDLIHVVAEENKPFTVVTFSWLYASKQCLIFYLWAGT